MPAIGPFPALPPGSITEIDHIGVLYIHVDALNHNTVMMNEEGPNPTPLFFAPIVGYWKQLGKTCIARFAEASPDEANAGWRLYVGDITNPEQLSYRPMHPALIDALGAHSFKPELLDLFMGNVNHPAMKVGVDTFRILRDHPNFRAVARWSTRQGRVSVRLKGPIGEDLEFTCPYVDARFLEST